MELLIDPLFDLSGMLCEEESRHCIKVMRHRAGDTVSICDGRGTLYTGRIAEADSRGCLIADIEATVMPGRGYGVHIAVAPTKNIDRLEWFVEKATELGIDRITPIVCDHSERTRLRLDRLERIATAAAKQSLKYRLPLISEPLEADRLMRQSTESGRFILHCNDNPKPHLLDVVTPATDVVVLIGPEGDFSDREIETARAHRFVEATLGQSRLRTETAAMAACHIVNLRNEAGRR